MELLKQLIFYIIKEVNEAGVSLPKTKLMKLLYLIDVETYRTFHRLLTSAHWFFYLYGPYATEVDSMIDSLAGYHIEERQFVSRSGRRGFSYTMMQEPDLESILSLDERLVAYAVLSKWKDEELNTILDHVYFETPPMVNAQFEQELDFSTIDRAAKRTSTDVSVAPIPGEIIQRLREEYKASLQRRRAEASRIHIDPPRYDEIYVTNLKVMNTQEESGLEEFVRSPVSISESAKNSLSEQS